MKLVRWNLWFVALGYIKSKEDLEIIAIGVSPNSGSPIFLKDVATINIGPELRRGLADWNGEGETVGGIVIIRYGENALAVIERVKERLAELKKSLPDDVTIDVAYDRSGLIDRAIDNLSNKLIEESIIVALVIIAFLASRKKFLCCNLHFANRGSYFIFYNETAGNKCKHYVARWNCNCNRCNGGCFNSDGGKCCNTSFIGAG